MLGQSNWILLLSSFGALSSRVMDCDDSICLNLGEDLLEHERYIDHLSSIGWTWTYHEESTACNMVWLQIRSCSVGRKYEDGSGVSAEITTSTSLVQRKGKGEESLGGRWMATIPSVNGESKCSIIRAQSISQNFGYGCSIYLYLIYSTQHKQA